MTRISETGIDPDEIVEQLYDIALDPSTLDSFIDVWNNAGLDVREARQTLEQIDQFDATFQTHLRRAEAFLGRGEQGSASASLAKALAPFHNLAALIVDRNLIVVACNDGAATAYGVGECDPLSGMPLSAEMFATLQSTLTEVLSTPERPDRMLKLETGEAANVTLFQIRRLEETAQTGQPLVLIVTTQYHWQAALGETLEEVFGLTGAEQGIVRALVEGRDAKSIAAERGTSEGTVRSQIKSILAKMNARSQSEVIRLVLSLRDVAGGLSAVPREVHSIPANLSADWLKKEAMQPLKTLILPDGRRMDYHEMGPANGAPVLLTHMGYCLVRWSAQMIKQAHMLGLRVLCPVRAGYGESSNIDPGADIVQSTRADTLALLKHLGITRLPVLSQGNDLMFVADLAAAHPDVVSDIIGICARPCLPGDAHYAGMDKWHRFFMSTAKHAPHLLKFTAKAGVALARRMGPIAFVQKVNGRSPSDVAILHNPELRAVLAANAELCAGPTSDIAQAYTMELLASESDWTHLMHAAKGTPTIFINGIEDPALDSATIAAYREHYPWIDIEVVPNTGQLLIYKHFAAILPRVAKLAHAARPAQAGQMTQA